MNDIYGKDPYQPSLWQRIKDWWNCKIRGRHHLPIYVSTGVYECSRCDYSEKQNEIQLSTELIDELVEATENNNVKIFWDYNVLKESNMKSIDEEEES